MTDKPTPKTLLHVVPKIHDGKKQYRTPADPETGLTRKQEAFCQAVAREGMNYTDAYKFAYQTENMQQSTIYVDACRTAKKPKVAERLLAISREMQGEYSASLSTRRERILVMLERTMREAKTDAAKLRAAELLGKTIGLYRDVSENVETDGSSLAELEAQLASVIKRNAS